MTPKLSLDFTSASLNSAVSVARANNTATAVNSLGVISVVNADLPRFDHDPVTLACKGLLVEESRTNFAMRSGDMSLTSPWYANGATNFTRVANAAVAPDGTTTATQIVVTANGTISGGSDYAGLGAAGGTTFSFFVKKGSSATLDNTFLVRNITTSTNLLSIKINYDTGVITHVIGSGCSSVKYADGWWRVVMPAITGVNAEDTLRFNPAVSGALLAGDNFYIWGGQFEKAAFATSYIPTTTTALTRNADVATITGTNFTSFWNSVQGGASAQATPSTVSGIHPLVQFDDGTANEIITLRGNTTNPELYIVDGGTPQAQLDAGTIAANTAYSLTGWWATNDCKARQDPGAVVTDTTATIPTVTQMRIGSDGTNYLNGTIATIDYYDSFFGRPIYTRRKNKVFPSLL